MEKPTLVYQAYGIPEVMRQTQFSILSLLKVISSPDLLNIYIYTDNKRYFADFFKDFTSIHIIEISKEQIKKWRGAIDFVHRVKIEILLDAARRGSGPLLYCDGDTYFQKDPTDIFSHISDRLSLMHIAESVLEDAKDPLTKKIYKFTKKYHFQVGNNDALAIGASTTMWNAGVIGISHKNKELLPLILQLTDQMYAIYQKHVMEQLAVSYILQINCEIRATDKEILHYWDQKPEFQTEVDKFLTQNQDARTAMKNFGQFHKPMRLEKRKKKTFWSFFRD